jgi:hypothetical protein
MWKEKLEQPAYAPLIELSLFSDMAYAWQHGHMPSTLSTRRHVATVFRRDLRQTDNSGI